LARFPISHLATLRQNVIESLQETIMVRPHYVTKRVGEDYVLVRVDPVGHVGRIISGGVGALLLSRGVRGGGWGAMVACVAGSGFLYHALTGRNPIHLLGDKEQAKHGEEKDSPSFPGEAESRQLPSDALEEASMESFPASDPPASMHNTAGKTS
jgi:hypothetical protein